MSISTTLTTKMSEKGITQTQLASEAGYAQSYISQICSGKRIPTIGALTKISDCLGVPVQLFLRESPPEKGSSLPAQERRLLELFHALDEPNRAMLLSLAEQMSVAQGVRRRRSGRKAAARTAP